MSFRDDREAMRARLDELEAELARQAETVATAHRNAAELDRARARIAELERENARLRVELQGASRRTYDRVVAGGVALLVAVLAAGIGWVKCTPMTWSNSLASPTLAQIDLDATPRPAPITGTAGGRRSPPGGCAGYYPDAPQLLLVTRVPRRMHFALSQSLLVLLEEDGTVHCEPALRTLLPPGQHRVWVGTATGAEEAFVLTLEPE